MDKGIVQRQLGALIEEFLCISSYPDIKNNDRNEGLTKDYKPLQRPELCLDEMMDNLRISIKYLHFDLEATRRENTYLLRLIDDGEE